ncbi:MAG: glycosyltransferase family 39 protein [Chloroflexi bacterium]|nr:glycosyltransferase family 39 protein [Chloroflexota bacterium]
MLLIATAFRFFAIDTAPPGWRDDELIEFNMDRRIADDWRPLFITEAEGHEPVYHYLHAGTILLFGDNIVGYKWLPMASGLLTIVLTYALAKKMFGARVALLAAALMVVSFWPIMYSRFGVRHIGLLPWMLVAMYWLYPVRRLEIAATTTRSRPAPTDYQPTKVGFAQAWLRLTVVGICLAAGMMTYFAGRAVPIILAGFLAYLLIFQRSILKRVWWRYAAAIAIGAILTVPMFVEIANTPGAEKRTEVVGGPLIELRNGNVQPTIETTLGTLGMFTFAGDPESLYNVPGRPVFDWITGAVFYLGVIICLIRLKRVESGFALAWLIIGIAPAFVSVPAASFSHTIAALPVVYVLGAVGIVEVVDRYTSRQGNKETGRQGNKETGRQGNKVNALSTYLLISLSTLLIGLNGWLAIRDYFGTWANDWLVQFQYHAPTREIAQWLDQNPQITDVAIGTNQNELVLDPLALDLDLKRADTKIRWFSPATAVVLPPGGTLVFSSMQSPGEDVVPLVGLLEDQSALQRLSDSPDGLSLYLIGADLPLRPSDDLPIFDGSFGLLGGGSLPANVHAGMPVSVQTTWQVFKPMDSATLKSFVHLLDERNQVMAGDDRFEINAGSLQVGDFFMLYSRLTLPPTLKPDLYRIEVGLYQSDSGQRLLLPDGRDHMFITPLEVVAP